MKHLKKILQKKIQWCVVLFIGSLFPSMNCIAQNLSLDTIPSATSAPPKTGLFFPRKTEFGLQTGTSFFTSSFGTGFSTFVSPHLSYKVSKRFSLGGGISIVNTSLNGFSAYTSEGRKSSLSGYFTDAMVFLSGQYALSNRVTITGTAYKQFNLFGDIPGMKANDFNNAQGVYMNVHYKVLDNFHIDAGFGYSKGYNPFYSPYDTFFDLSPSVPFHHPIH
jgi:hypothetical protein